MSDFTSNRFKDSVLRSAERLGFINEKKTIHDVGEAFWNKSPKNTAVGNETYIPAGKSNANFNRDNTDRIFSYYTIILQRLYLDKTFGIKQGEHPAEELKSILKQMGVDDELIEPLVIKGEVTIGNTTGYSSAIQRQQTSLRVYQADVKMNDVERGDTSMYSKPAQDYDEIVPKAEEPKSVAKEIFGDINEKVELMDVEKESTGTVNIDFFDENGNVLKSFEKIKGNVRLSKLASSIRTPGKLPREMQNQFRVSGNFPFDLAEDYILDQIVVNGRIEFKWDNSKKKFVYNKQGWKRR